MYAYFQPRISVAQEEADIKEMIDEEYERKEQEERDYYKQMEEDYYKQIEDYCMLGRYGLEDQEECRCYNCRHFTLSRRDMEKQES